MIDPEEVVNGLSNDMVIRRLRNFLVTKGIPDGNYLLHDVYLTKLENEQYKGGIEFTLARSSVEEPNTPGSVLVFVSFNCMHELGKQLSLDILQSAPIVRRGDDIIYRFFGLLRPLFLEEDQENESTTTA